MLPQVIFADIENRMRFLFVLSISAVALAQAPLIGVNSTAAALSAGTRDTIASITVDPSSSGGDLFAVMLTAEGVPIRIELPDGRIITQENASAAGFTWEVAPQGQGDALLFPGLQGKVNHILLLPPNAPKGQYKVHADARDSKEDSALIVEFLPLGTLAGGAAESRDTVRVALTAAGMFHYAGEKVELVAGVFEGQRGLNGARLTGVAVKVDENGLPQGNPMPLNFRPSGPGADGSYNAELPLTAAGKYEVALKVQGKYSDGTDFERNAGTDVDIEPRRAQVLSVSEQPVDDDGNSLIDRIELTARVRVELAGEYNLTVDLKAASGQYMQAYGKAQLGVGEGTIIASLTRSSLIHVGANGPYKISARLFRKEGNTQAFASLLEDAGMTRAYEQSSFDRGPIYFTGAANATPESASRRGPFERLVVSVGVFTPGGMCSWFGGLQSGRTNVEFLNNYGQLPKGAGQITLTFDGYKISDTSDGRPLDIGKVGISCGGSRQITHLEKPIALFPFPQGTFVKAAPGFELVAVERLGSMERGKITTMFLRIETQGGFDQTVDLSIDGLPEGVEARNFPRNVPARAIGGVTYQLVIASNVPLGRYPVTVRAKYKTMERSKTYTIVLDQ